MGGRRYRISGIRVPYDQAPDFPKLIRKKLGGRYRKADIRDIEIARRSIDARRKPEVKFVYTLDFTSGSDLPLAGAPDLSYHPPVPGPSVLRSRPVIIGFGPCGMFCGLMLARAGYRPLIIERGRPMEERVRQVRAYWAGGPLDPECNVQFGEGGAGTFSDGKLNSGIHDPRVRLVLETFVRAGADPDLLYDNKPHIGTDRLRAIVVSIRKEILALGGEIRFSTRLDGFETEARPGGGRRLAAVLVRRLGEGQEEAVRDQAGEAAAEAPLERIPASEAVLAIGHSARDTFQMLKTAGLPMEQKAFSIGVRIEHPQSMIDRAQYGEEAAASGLLPPASYKLNWHCRNGRGVYTFCMCPGGEVVDASTEPDGICVNGMSDHDRGSGTANCGLLVDVRTSDFDDPEDPLAGVRFQKKYERMAYKLGGGRPPKASWKDFREETERGRKVRGSLPDFAQESLLEGIPALGRKLQGFDEDGAVMTAVETRSSSPVRIRRAEDLSSPVEGLYPAGEGCGYAGGITSAAVDGIRIAEAIQKRGRPAAE